MIIKEVSITRFRDIYNQNFKLGKHLTAIIGRNKTMKSTLLGIISQPFTITKEENPLYGKKAIGGFTFRSQFSEKFKIDLEHEKVGEHLWSITLENALADLAKENPFPITSVSRGKTDLRFWYQKSKDAGTGYIQIPVYFLSLGRLSPVGETSINSSDTVAEFTPEENTEYIRNYADILSDTEVTSEDDAVEFSKKGKDAHIGVSTQKYSSLTNSAGQSNIGKIITAVFSFKRLKEQLPNDYKGGILLIDEIDATLHPSAQKKLIKFLHSYSKKLSLQVIFTTHSNHVIDALREMLVSDHIEGNNKALFLQRNSEKVEIKEISTIKEFNQVNSDLLLEEYHPQKLTVYCEDNVGKGLLCSIMSKYRSRFSVMGVGIGYAEYVKLHKANISEFRKNLIVLDGDVKKENPSVVGYLKKNKNILLLPDDTCPEISFYTMLQDDDYYAIFTKKRKSGDSKEVLFRDFMPASLPQRHTEKKEFCKRWFSSLKGKETAVYSVWKAVHKEECEKFKSLFIKAFNERAKENEIEEIIES